jgi:hypothetical protein
VIARSVTAKTNKEIVNKCDLMSNLKIDPAENMWKRIVRTEIINTAISNVKLISTGECASIPRRKIKYVNRKITNEAMGIYSEETDL